MIDLVMILAASVIGAFAGMFFVGTIRKLLEHYSHKKIEDSKKPVELCKRDVTYQIISVFSKPAPLLSSVKLGESVGKGFTSTKEQKEDFRLALSNAVNESDFLKDCLQGKYRGDGCADEPLRGYRGRR